MFAKLVIFLAILSTALASSNLRSSSEILSEYDLLDVPVDIALGEKSLEAFKNKGMESLKKLRKNIVDVSSSARHGTKISSLSSDTLKKSKKYISKGAMVAKKKINSDCSGTHIESEGLALGICIPDDGRSVRFACENNFEKDSVQVYGEVFDNPDCTGSATQVIPYSDEMRACSIDTNTYNDDGYFATAATHCFPSGKQDLSPGIVQAIWLGQECVGDPVLYFTMSLNVCTPELDEDGGYFFYKFTSCSEDGMKMVMYKDRNCQHAVQKSVLTFSNDDFVFDQCNLQNDDDGYFGTESAVRMYCHN